MLSRDELQEEYVNCIVDGLDTDALLDIAVTYYCEKLDEYNDEQLVAEVQVYYPELLEL